MPTMTKENKEECLVRPFTGKIMNKPAMLGFRVIKGNLSKGLDNMGYENWKDEDEPKERCAAFENHLRLSKSRRDIRIDTLDPVPGMYDVTNNDIKRRSDIEPVRK